jgi:hypothetical protein
MIVARFLTGAVWFSFVIFTQHQGAGRGRLLIDLRIATDSLESGFMPVRATSDTVFYVDRAHVVSDSDIQSARVFLTKDGIQISMRLKPSAMSRFRTVVKRHAGERLAVLLDGHLIAALPIMPSPPNVKLSSNPYLDIIGLLADSTGQRIKALITARWPADSR